MTATRAAALLCAALSWGCTQRTQAPAPPIQPASELSQRTLLPADPYLDARRALADRIASRERRFREAFAPGSLWAYLRPEQADIDGGRLLSPALTEIGRELFATDFGPRQGLGNGLGPARSPLAGPRPAPNLRHVHYKEFGGPDATRCLSCHHVGGEGGGGFQSDNAFLDGDGKHPASALPRNPRALVGAALLQLLGQEMSAELLDQVRRARLTSSGGATPLSAKGVSFGTLRFLHDGRVDPKGIVGVDPDLIVRPFGWKGDTATLRDAVEQALQKNLGVQPESWITDPRRRGEVGLLGDGPRADDPDGDGVTREATEGMVTALVTYLAALGPPIEEMPEEASYVMMASRGAELFGKLGCAGCHVPELSIQGTVIGLGPTGRSGPRLDLAPLLSTPGRAGRLAGVRLYSDLKRHDMGESLAEPRDHHGVSRRHWLTPPLWGVAASAPYLHDGRASTVDQAILAHDGEGRPARDAYEKLSTEEQGAVNLFLSVLDRPHHLEFRR